MPDRCTGADGVTARGRIVCAGKDEFGSCGWRKAIVEWRDLEDEIVAGPYVVEKRLPSYVEWSFACNDHGRVMMAVEDQFWIVDRGGIRGSAQSLNGAADSIEKVGWRDGFFVAWGVWNEGLRGRFYSGDGEAIGAEIAIASERPEAIAVQSGEDGGVLIAWSALDSLAGRRNVYATMIDGMDVQPVVQLNEFPHLYWVLLRIRSDGPRRFLVAWDNQNQAGWVARRVSTDGADPTTTTTTTTLPPDVPEFVDFGVLAEPFVLGYEDPPYQPVLAGDRAGRWVAAWRDSLDPESGVWPFFGSVFSTSTDDARRWSPPASVADAGFTSSSQARIATNQNGVWLMAWAPREEPWILTRRSNDGGRTWGPTVAHPELYAANSVAVDELSLAAGDDGIWVAAWIERVWSDRDEYFGDETLTCEIHAAVSGDSGRNWRPSRKLGESWCNDARRGLRVATDRRGDWLVAWITDHVYGVTSTDNALTWSQMDVLVEDVAGSPYGLDVAADGFGNWLMAFAGTPGTELRWRIYLSRRRDPRSGWTTPAGIAPWHDDDGGLDDSPSIASGGRGRWGIVWRTYTDMDGNGLDADIASSFSSDAGATWSTPRPVDAEARGDSRDDASPSLAHAGADTWVTIWRTSEEPGFLSYTGNGTIRFARTRGNCGNGARDPAEECDDGNDLDGDGCDSNCLATACGNVIVTSGEQCDDGNDDDTDECLSTCRLAICGDGFVQTEVEECDDGNANSDDACSIACTTSVCGDGVLWSGVEACDDGNDDNNDGCLRDCRVATCGDGYLTLGTEECDDGNRESGDGCSRRCVLETCTLPAERATASTALRVLRKAVGLKVRCKPSECDLDRDGRVTTADALDALRAAVSFTAASCGTISSVTVRLESDELLGALQFELSYRDAPARIAERNGEPACTVLVTDNVLTAINVEPRQSNVRLGVISLQGFRGPLDLLRCELESPVAPSANAFAIRVEDATDLNGDAIERQVGLQVMPQ